jgi:predicted N-acetyltransferase YhbS
MLTKILHQPQYSGMGIFESVLDTIFVNPGRQKTGIGSQLVKLCLNQVDTDVLPLFLSAVASAVKFDRNMQVLV